MNLQSGQVNIADGKGGKSRFVWIGSNTRAAVWRYLQERQVSDPALPAFISATAQPLTAHSLHARLIKIGRRVGVTVQDIGPRRSIGPEHLAIPLVEAEKAGRVGIWKIDVAFIDAIAGDDKEPVHE